MYLPVFRLRGIWIVLLLLPIIVLFLFQNGVALRKDICSGGEVLYDDPSKCIG